MGYEPSRSPSVVDNLALGIRNITVEDDASLSQQGSPYRNGNPASTSVPTTLPHVHGAPLQPRGPYTTFLPPEYGPYYPGTPSGQHPRLLWYVARVDVFQIHPCTPRHRSPQLLCRRVCIPR